MSTKPFVAAAALALFASATFSPVVLGAFDAKSVSPSLCQAYAPDTTAAELQITQNGVYNPGASIEKVICSLPRDFEGSYVEGDVMFGVYYRVLGATPGRITCTVFVGSTGMQTEAVLAVTKSGDLVSGGTREAIFLNPGTQPAANQGAPSTLICAISPKTQLASILIEEYGVTAYPDAD